MTPSLVLLKSPVVLKGLKPDHFPSAPLRDQKAIPSQSGNVCDVSCSLYTAVSFSSTIYYPLIPSSVCSRFGVPATPAGWESVLNPRGRPRFRVPHPRQVSIPALTQVLMGSITILINSTLCVAHTNASGSSRHVQAEPQRRPFPESPLSVLYRLSLVLEELTSWHVSGAPL